MSSACKLSLKEARQNESCIIQPDCVYPTYNQRNSTVRQETE